MAGGGRHSSICALIAAAAVGVALLSFVDWALNAGSVTTYRWLLALLALAYALAALRLRGPAPRHSEQLANAAGLAILVLALTGVLPAVLGDGRPVRRRVARGSSPNGWDWSCSRSGAGWSPTAPSTARPGPAYLGVANLAAFIVSAGVGPTRPRCSTGRC